MIDAAGVYNLDPTGYRVSVEVKNRLVVIVIADKNGVVVDKDDDASSIHRWFLYWDKSTQWLWRVSSDVGTAVWKLSTPGVVVRENVTPETHELINAIPREVYAKLPDAKKAYWEELGVRDRPD